MTTIRSRLSKQAINEPVPSDWCYVYNFKDADAPIAVPLEPGKAVIFQKDMDELINVLRVEIPKVFESKEYEKQKNLILEEFQKKQKDLFSRLEDEAQAKGFSIRKTVSGLLIVPVKKTGEPLKEDEFEALDEKTRKKQKSLAKCFRTGLMMLSGH